VSIRDLHCKYRAVRGLGALVLGLALSTGCRSECRDLCTRWYDYQQDICGDLDTEDVRVQCLADYRSGQVSEDELLECATIIEQISDLRDLEDSQARAACCDPTTAECELGALGSGLLP
tara:strand:- start:501 stop:857 length:357 start_codon:yes stop_codon:yes gene_type:complete